ncbi:uncharacterized protein LOC123416254 [Hordeum vulgare subsp. vulgare]|uniref:Predicted protein n=1 Tax=Hordeum vulgare subsp. vulgare TaxID=112509 RepID=F2EDV5_HORVV|nr:uncharacterized protein LOC123416254 [Hordeum vulgare subsp. vulgare]BAK05527.1 predicted protein [Hordeum vulgare subsp. vulgare]
MVLMEAASTSASSIQEDEGGMHGALGCGQCEPRAGEAVRMSGAGLVRPGEGTMARRWWRLWPVGVRIGSKARQLMVGGKAVGLIRSSRRAGGQVARRQRSSKAPSVLSSSPTGEGEIGVWLWPTTTTAHSRSGEATPSRSCTQSLSREGAARIGRMEKRSSNVIVMCVAGCCVDKGHVVGSVCCARCCVGPIGSCWIIHRL